MMHGRRRVRERPRATGRAREAAPRVARAERRATTMIAVASLERCARSAQATRPQSSWWPVARPARRAGLLPVPGRLPEDVRARAGGRASWQVLHCGRATSRRPGAASSASQHEPGRRGGRRSRRAAATAATASRYEP